MPAFFPGALDTVFFSPIDPFQSLLFFIKHVNPRAVHQGARRIRDSAIRAQFGRVAFALQQGFKFLVDHTIVSLGMMTIQPRADPHRFGLDFLNRQINMGSLGGLGEGVLTGSPAGICFFRFGFFGRWLDPRSRRIKCRLCTRSAGIVFLGKLGDKITPLEGQILP